MTRAISAIFGLIMAIFFLGIVVLPLYQAYGTGDTVTATVVKTERVVQGDSSRYLIFTADEVFENTDTLLLLKFNSSDLYGKIGQGQTCTFDVNGWRIPFFSMYRNILEADCG